MKETEKIHDMKRIKTNEKNVFYLKKIMNHYKEKKRQNQEDFYETNVGALPFRTHAIYGVSWKKTVVLHSSLNGRPLQRVQLMMSEMNRIL